MPTENPYQSPQSDSTPETARAAESSNRHLPTWRFWLLAIIGLPGAAGIFWLVTTNFPPGNNPVTWLTGMTFGGCVLATYLACCVYVFKYWNAPRQKQLGFGPGTSAGFVQLSIWLLAIIATPTAFFTTCTPIGIGSAAWMYSKRNEQGILLGIALGIVVGIVCAIMTLLLARNVWLDAIGRPPKRKPESPNSKGAQDHD